MIPIHFYKDENTEAQKSSLAFQDHTELALTRSSSPQPGHLSDCKSQIKAERAGKWRRGRSSELRTEGWQRRGRGRVGRVLGTPASPPQAHSPAHSLPGSLLPYLQDDEINP